MKKLLYLFLCCAASAAFADETSNVDYGQATVSPTLDLIWEFDYVTYQGQTCAIITGVRNSGGATVSGAISVPRSVAIETSPDVYASYIVKAIDSAAFRNQIGITSISIPATVEDVAAAFCAGCTLLASISVDSANPWFATTDGLLYDKDFKQLIACPAVTESIALPNSVTNIGVKAFANCHRLTTITIPASVTNIGAYAFTGCTLLESLRFNGNAPNAGATICDNPKNIVIYKKSNSTGWGVSPWTTFKDVRDTTPEDAGKVLTENCGNLTWHYRVVNDGVELYNNGESVIPTGTAQTYTYDTENKKWVGDGSLIIPSALGGLPVTRIGAYAFNNCKALTSISIPSTVTYIGDYAFNECGGVESVSLPTSLTELGVSPFSGTWISSLELPARLSTLHDNPVAGCMNLDTITVNSKSRYFSSVDNVLYNWKKNRLYGVQTYIEKFTVPSNVVWIASNAFSCCTFLSAITYEGNAPAIDDNGRELYADVDEDLISYTAAGTKGWNGDIASTNMPADAKWPLVGSNRRTIKSLYAPEGSGGDPSSSDLYEIDASGITWYYRLVDNVAEIYHAGSCAAESESAITAVTLPATLGKYLVKGIGEGALSNLRGITSVTIPDTYETIGDFAFSNCTSLASVTIGNGVRAIGRWPFYGTAITELSIPASVSAIDGNPVAGVSMLTTISTADAQPYYSTIDGILYNIDATTLLACPATKSSLTLPTTVTAIADDAFYGCHLIASGTDTKGKTTWKYTTDGATVTITEVNGATGIVTIPATLGGQPVVGLDTRALNGCTGITAFVSLSASFTVKNKCLYSADGTILVRVPDTLVFPYSVKTSVCNFTETKTTIVDIDTASELPIATTSVSVTTNVSSKTSSTEYVTSNATFESVLKDVVIVRAFAFRGCNAFPAIPESVDRISTTPYMNGPIELSKTKSRTITTVKTAYSATASQITTALVLTDSVRKVEPDALAGSGITCNGDLPYVTVDDYPYTIELAALNATDAIALADEEFFPLASPYPSIVSDSQYHSYFVLGATAVLEKSGYYNVTAEISAAAIDFPKSYAQMTSKIAEVAAGTADRVTLSTKPGLYYTIYSSSTAGENYNIVDSKLATGTELELLMMRPSSESGFYRLGVSVTNPQ